MDHRIHPDLKLGTVRLKVSSLARSLAFYRDVIGLKLLSQAANAAELTADGQTALIALEEVPNAVVVPRRTASGLYHVAIRVPSRQDLGVALQRLSESGIRIGQSDHLVSEALYMTDPDQNGIEIYADRPRSSWRRNEDGSYAMATDPIDWDGLLELARAKERTGLPPGTAIGHVHFHVGDLRQAKEFYCDRLGFDISADYSRGMGALFVSAGGYHHHIGLNIWAGAGAPPAPANGTGLAYYTIVLPDRTELEKTLERLRAAGIAATEQDGAWFATDPFGIQTRLQTEQR